MTVGSLARYNSVLAAIPLVQFLFIAGSRSDAGWWRAWRSIALSSTVTIVLFVAGHAALTNWLRPEKVYHASRVYLFDLIGTSRQAHVNLVPGRWTEEERREMVTTCYAPRSFDFTWLKCDWVLHASRPLANGASCRGTGGVRSSRIRSRTRRTDSRMSARSS